MERCRGCATQSRLKIESQERARRSEKGGQIADGVGVAKGVQLGAAQKVFGASAVQPAARVAKVIPVAGGVIEFNEQKAKGATTGNAIAGAVASEATSELGGAAIGAIIGSAVEPGVGTAVGAVAGAVVDFATGASDAAADYFGSGQALRDFRNAQRGADLVGRLARDCLYTTKGCK